MDDNNSAGQEVQNPFTSPANLFQISLFTAALVALCLISRVNYSLFHSVVEIAGIIFAFSIFILIWNTRRVITDGFFLILGISFFFVGIIDLVPLLAYSGVGILPGNYTDIPTQLWIAARYFLSITLLIATIFIGRSITRERKYDAGIIVAACSAACALIFVSIFFWQDFPPCFIVGSGLTLFKIASEYIISLLLIAATLVFWTRRHHFDREVRQFLVAALFFLILGELAFTSYVSEWSIMNLLGHMSNFISFYLFYRAIVVTGLTRPYDLLFHDLVENLNDVILTLDLQGTITNISPAIRRLSGYNPDDLIRQNITRFIHPDDHARVLEWIRQTLCGQPGENEFRIRTRDGRERYVRISSGPMVMGGRVAGFTCIMTDITERKQAEESLLENHAKYQQLVENISDVILMLDLQGTILYISPVVQRLFGYGVPEVIGQPYSRFIHPDDLPYVTEGFRRRVEDRDYGVNEFRILTKNGCVRYVRTTQTPVTKEGVVTAINYTVADITDRRQAEVVLRDFNQKLQQGIDEKTAELRESEMRHRLLFESSRDAIMTLEPPDWRFTSGNPATIAMFQAETEAGFTLKSPWEWSPEYQPDGRISGEKAREMIEKAVREGTFFFEWTHKRLNGEVFPATVLLTRFEWKEKQILQATVRDITDQKRAEDKIRASLDEKVTLLREIHHRVKNNLQIIISLVNLQMRMIDDERMKRIMAETQNRVRSMALVHEKLYQSEDISHIDLASYTQFLVTHLFAFYGVSSGEVVLDLDIGKIKLDINTAIPFGLILNELVSNALKHAFIGGRTGSLSIMVREEDTTLTLSVKDDGIGLPAAFDWRNAESLGLRLVISLVEQLDGTIELDRHAGTAFVIIIHEKEKSRSLATR